MEEKEILKKNGGVFGMIVTEAVVAAVILAAVLTVKYFFKDTYSSLKKWYNSDVCAETDINEVLKTDGEADEI